MELQHMRPGEKVLLTLRRHWIIYVFLSIYFFLAFFLSAMLYTVFGFTFLTNISVIIIWLFFSLFLYVEWLNHELDMYIVTNNRVIGIDQISFLNRTVSECNLGQVQEVNSKTSGLLANILNYGTLSIQTAGNKTTLKMDYAPNAIQAARKVLNIVDDYRDKDTTSGNIKNNDL